MSNPFHIVKIRDIIFLLSVHAFHILIIYILIPVAIITAN